MRRAGPPPLGAGTYLLLLCLDQAQVLRVGGLGGHPFPAGHYLYAGSALGPGGLQARLRHHLGFADRPHWHVDYLRQRAALEEVWYSEQTRRREHDWASLTQQLPGAVALVAGFGSSDCRCAAHLVHLEARPRLSAFGALVRRHFPQDAAVRGLGVAVCREEDDHAHIH